MSDVGRRVFLRMEDISLLEAGTSFSAFFLFYYHFISRNPPLAASLAPLRVQDLLAGLQC